MAIDDWKGAGDWNLTPTDWSLGAPPSLTEEAVIQSGDSTLSTAGWVDILNIISGAQLSLTSGATLNAASNLNDQGALTINTTSGSAAGVKIGGSLANTGTLSVDTFYQVHLISWRPLKYVIYTSGGSSVSIGGALTNSGAVDIGNGDLKAPTTVRASALVNTGSIALQGGLTTQATLDITGAAPSTLTGSVSLLGDALLEFGSGGIKAIGAGASLSLNGAGARVSIGAGAANSALSGLSSNAGTLDLEANGGRNAFSLATTASLNNSGTLNVFAAAGYGGALTLGGVLQNTGAVNVGASEMLGATTLTASGLVSTGSVTVTGDYSGLAQATLDITGAAPTTLTGSVSLYGDALLEFSSGGIKAIGVGASFQLGGAQARALIGAGATAKSALSGLSSNAGAFDLEGFSDRYGWGGVTLTTTTGLNNSGNLSVDALENQWGTGDGGSILTLGGALANTGAVNIGNAELWAPTTVAAKGLANKGTVTLAGASSETAQLTIAGQATNSGTVSIGAGSTLAVTGAGDAYTQSAGKTMVAGTLAGTVNADGGLIDFTSTLTSGDGTGALNIGAVGALEFGAAVDSSHWVNFTASTGTLDLGAPSSFAGVINHFAAADTIDLLNTPVTSLSYAPTTHTLTVHDGAAIVAALTFEGSYTTASFTRVSDGHGGTDILDPPASHWPSATSASTGMGRG